MLTLNRNGLDVFRILFLVYSYEGEHLGCILMQDEMYVSEKKTYGIIECFMINPEYTKKGIGSSLMTHFKKDNASNTKCDGFILVSEKSAVEFWKKVGFKKFEPSNGFKIWTVDDRKAEGLMLTF